MGKYPYATIRGTVSTLVRLTNTSSGNPRWEVVIKGVDGEDYAPVRTAPDSQLAHSITDAEYRVNVHTFSVTKDGLIGERA